MIINWLYVLITSLRKLFIGDMTSYSYTKVFADMNQRTKSQD